MTNMLLHDPIFTWRDLRRLDESASSAGFGLEFGTCVQCQVPLIFFSPAEYCPFGKPLTAREGLPVVAFRSKQGWDFEDCEETLRRLWLSAPCSGGVVPPLPPPDMRSAMEIARAGGHTPLVQTCPHGDKYLAIYCQKGCVGWHEEPVQFLVPEMLNGVSGIEAWHTDASEDTAIQGR